MLKNKFSIKDAEYEGLGAYPGSLWSGSTPNTANSYEYVRIWGSDRSALCDPEIKINNDKMKKSRRNINQGENIHK